MPKETITMPLEEDVLSIGKKLEKLVGQGQSDHETAMDMLKQLQGIPITLDVLQKTRIGMSVNVLRKASTKDDIQSLAKTLIKNWKKLLDNQDKSKLQRASSQDKSDSPKLSRSQSTDSNNSSSQSVSQAALAVSGGNGNSKSQNSQNSERRNSQDGEKRPVVSFPPLKGDVVIREKCRDMLQNSLKCDDKPDFDAMEVAARIEETVFNEFKDTGVKYKNRIKSRVMNLRDKNNPVLKLKIIHGELDPERFAVMKPEELASEDMKKLRHEMTQQAIKDHQLAQTGGTGTDQFKCGKCGKRNCTYNQVQTRSADEPMTTFVYCNECGNRWKMFFSLAIHPLSSPFQTGIFSISWLAYVLNA